MKNLWFVSLILHNVLAFVILHGWIDAPVTSGYTVSTRLILHQHPGAIALGQFVKAKVTRTTTVISSSCSSYFTL